MNISHRCGHAPSSPGGGDSPTGCAAPTHLAGLTLPVEALQMPRAAQPDAGEAQALQQRIGPDSTGLDPDRPLDLQRVGRNAMVSAIAQGGCFGLAFALNNYLRAAAGPVVKQLSGFFSPIVAGFLTSPAETAVREKTAMHATALPEGSSTLWHDAIPSVVLFSINKAYAKSRLPKFPPGSRAGMATTMVLSVAGTGLAGALGEGAAQTAGGRVTQRPLDTRATIERGLARGATLVPMGAANCYAARHLVRKGQLPPNLGLKPLGIGVVGWAGRNKAGNILSNRLAKVSRPGSPPPNPVSQNLPSPPPRAEARTPPAKPAN